MKKFNKFLINIFLALIFITTFSYAIGTGSGIDTGQCINTDDKMNSLMVNTLGPTDIIDLSASINNSTEVISNFIIKSLPDANVGILYMADGTTAVIVGQHLTQVEANGLKFDPIESCSEADAQFTYVGILDTFEGRVPATVTIPLILGQGCGSVISDDKNNPEIINSSDSVDILDLSGKDSNGDAVNSFVITSLPSANQGILYMADGTTAMTLNQILTLSEANGLRFDPNENFVGEVTFTYEAIDDKGVHGNSATVTIPIVTSGNSGDKPTTDDKNNPKMLNNLGAVNILDLSGTDSKGNAIEQFIITSLPTADQGILYMTDGTTAIRLNQVITIEEANGLRFDPNENFVGDVTFRYVSLDNSGVRGDFATVTIPLIAPVIGDKPIAYDKNNPEMSNRLGAVNILNLSGKDSNGDAIEQFIITSLPTANQGILYMADGSTPVLLNQTLTLSEANGLLFDPNENFVGDVRFTYVALDNNDIKSTNATVIIPLVNPVVNGLTADDKLNPKMLNILGAVNILDLSGKDGNGDAIEQFIITSLPTANQGVLYMADGSTPVLLNQTLTLAEANGLRFDPNINFIGDVKFTYMGIDNNGVKSSNATVTIPVEASYDTDIVTQDSVGVANGNSDAIIIDVLANDTGTLAGAIVLLVNSDGTFTNEITVEGEGVWTVNSDNMVVFTPVTPFVGVPTPIEYVARDTNGNVSNTSTVRITGQCVCKPYTESISVFSIFGIFLMLLFSTFIGLFFIKKEFKVS